MAYALLMLHINIKIAYHYYSAIGTDGLLAPAKFAAFHVAFHNVHAIFLIEGNSYLRSIREKYIARGNTPLLIPEFTPPITEARVSELVDQKILLDPRLRNEELLRWRKLIPNNGKQSGFSITQVPLWILCLVLSISVVLRFFAKNSS